MNTNSDNLSQTLEDLTILVSRITQEPEKIEIDLALDKTREIYDHLLKLQSGLKFIENEIIVESKKDEIISEKATIINEIKEVVEVSTKNSQEEKTENIIPEEKSPEPLMEFEEEKAAPVYTEVKVTKQEVVTEIKTKQPENDILAERFKKNEPLINEILASHGKRNISSVLQTKSVKNIEAAIGINERFEFVRELFNGDNATYLKTIRILDSSSNFNEAFNYINQTFSWDFENETVHKLLDLVRRRYITD